MMLKPKKIGDDLTLDEYNACQYLLYNMSCWNDTLILNTYSPYYGKYGAYLFQEQIANNGLTIVNEKQGTYRIHQTLTESTCIQKINVLQMNANLTKLHIQPTVKIFYKEPQKLKDGDSTTQNYDPTDSKDVNIWGDGEAKETPSFKEFTAVDIPATFENNVISFPLKDKKGNILPVNTIFSKRIYINYKFDKEPYIDFRNGKANSNDEILVDNQKDLINLVKNAPNTGELTVIRLDSNIDSPKPDYATASSTLGTYFINQIIFIENGQNVEIRGGTVNPARINASISKKCFVVKKGGRLTLNNIACEYGDASKSYYDKGRGGAIIVEGYDEEFGILKCENCIFEHNFAYYGGAIFSYHAGLHINNCLFQDNTVYNFGGAIDYEANDVKIEFMNIITTPGQAVKISAVVKDMNGNLKNEGEIVFYIRLQSGVDTHIGTARVKDGVAILDDYTVPVVKETTEYTLVAEYTGGMRLDNEVAKATLTIKVPEKYTASWIVGNVVKAKIGEAVTLNAKIVNAKGIVSTEPEGVFYVHSKAIHASRNGNTYTLRYILSDSDLINPETKEFQVGFSLIKSEDYSCNTITAKVTINMEKPHIELDGYVTGLFVTGESNVTKDLVKKWVKVGITDVYVRMNDYTNKSSRSQIEQVINTFGEVTDSKKIRVHALMSMFYNESTDKWAKPQDATRLEFIKSNIDYIAEKYPLVKGIVFDYFRDEGKSTDSKKVQYVNEAMSKLYAHIRDKNKNYCISMTGVPEGDNSKTKYGQDVVALNEYYDYIVVLTHKADYTKSGKEMDDKWVKEKLQYVINQKVSSRKIISSLQTYKTDTSKSDTTSSSSSSSKEVSSNTSTTASSTSSNKTNRTKDELTKTAKSIKNLSIKGIALYKDSSAPEGYVQSFKDIMGG